MKKEIEQGNFREDLYYRLSVFQIHLPPLRERKEDIEILARTFYPAFFQIKLGKQVEGMTPEFLTALKAADWRGNIRELRNVIERSMIICDKQLTLQDLPLKYKQPARRATSKNYSEFELAAMEKHHITKVLQYTKGNKTEASRLLKIGLTTLYRKIEEYGISL